MYEGKGRGGKRDNSVVYCRGKTGWRAEPRVKLGRGMAGRREKGSCDDQVIPPVTEQAPTAALWW